MTRVLAAPALMALLAASACKAGPGDRPPVAIPPPTPAADAEPTVDATAAAGAIDAAPSPPPITIDVPRAELDRHVSDVNALVPPRWRKKLRFELTRIEIYSFESVWVTLAAPVGWEPDRRDNARRAPASAKDFIEDGHAAELTIGYGSCQKPCDADATASHFIINTQIATLRERREPNLRVEVLQGNGPLQLVSAHWRDGAERFYACNLMNLPPAAAEVMPAFEKACSLYAVTDDRGESP